MNSLSVCEIAVLMQISFLSKKPYPYSSVETTFTSQMYTQSFQVLLSHGTCCRNRMPESSLKSGFELLQLLNDSRMTPMTDHDLNIILISFSALILILLD